MDPSGKAIFAAKSKRSGADGSIVSDIGGLTLLFAIRNGPVSTIRGSRIAPTNRSSDSTEIRQFPFILTACPELEMNLRDRSLSQAFARKGNAVLSTMKPERRKQIVCPARRGARGTKAAV